MGNFRRANSNGKGLSNPVVIVLIALNILVLGGGLYIYYDQKERYNDQFTATENETIQSTGDTITPKEVVTFNQPKSTILPTEDELKPKDNPPATSNHLPTKTLPTLREKTMPTVLIQAKNNSSTTRYTVAKGLAHFHNQPDPSTKRKAFINHWNKAVLEPLAEENGFIYIVYTNHLGQTSKGWLQLKDLEPIGNK